MFISGTPFENIFKKLSDIIVVFLFPVHFNVWKLYFGIGIIILKIELLYSTRLRHSTIILYCFFFFFFW